MIIVNVAELVARAAGILRSGQVALELEGLSLRAFEQLDQVHALGSLLGSAGALPASDFAAFRIGAGAA